MSESVIKLIKYAFYRLCIGWPELVLFLGLYYCIGVGIKWWIDSQQTYGTVLYVQC